MPQNASKNYEYPPGTRGIPDETIESPAYNGFLDDLVDNDLNIARPLHRGGTGATTPDQALINLSAEKAAQAVVNYDSHVWMPGSFYSAGSATNAPVAGHAFAGICYLNEALATPLENKNVTVSARDMDDTVVPSRVYVREKKANVWGPWTVIDATTLPFPPGGGLSATTILAAIQELDAEKASIVYVDTELGELAAHADAADVTLQGNITAGDALKVDKAGDTMTGPLILPAGPPTSGQYAAHKQYVDDAIANAVGLVLTASELRFTRSLSQHMYRTFTATSNQPWTMSMWVQRAGSLGTHQALFGVETGGNKIHVAFMPDNSLGVYAGANGDVAIVAGMPPQTNLNLWLNIVWWGRTVGPPTDPKFHTWQVNNIGAWSMTALLAPPNNLNAAQTHHIGQPVGYPDATIKDVVFVDGAEVPISSFGESIGGVWTPKVYNGPFGPNGFKLNFANRYSPVSTSLGRDVSGNNNHWIAANF